MRCRTRRIRLAALAVVGLSLVGQSCVRRHRSLGYGSDDRPGRVPVVASWRGLSFQHFDLRGMDARNRFAALRETPKREFEAALLADLQESAIFDELTQGDPDAQVEVAAVVRRFRIETAVSPFAGFPCLGLFAMLFPQTTYESDIQLELVITPMGQPDRPLAVAKAALAEEERLNLMNKSALDRKTLATLRRVARELKKDLVRQGRAIVAGAPASRRPRRYAQERRTQSPVAPVPAPASPSGSGYCDPSAYRIPPMPRKRRTLAVLDLTAGKGVRKELVDVASDWIRSSLVNSGHFKVLDRAYMQMVLQEQEFSMSDCSDAECVVEVGRMLSAETLVAGRISKLGSLYTVNAQIIDVTTGEVIRSAARPCTRCADDVLLSVVACVAMQLVGGR